MPRPTTTGWLALAGLAPAGPLPDSPVGSLVMLQGAFSHFAFAGRLPHRKGKGSLGGMQARVAGPIVVTHTLHDAALSNLPDDQAGSGSGIYKMASSLGASFGVAISAAIFTALNGSDGTNWLDGVITFAGRQDNLAVRQAAMVALAFNLLMVVAAVVSIMLTIPKHGTPDAEASSG